MGDVIVAKPPRDLIARRTERVRRELAEAAVRLFSEQGFEATTVEEIAATVDVSPRTFYRHYPTKGDVIFGLALASWLDLISELSERPLSEPLTDSIEGVFLRKFEATDSKGMRNFEELLGRNPLLRARWLEETRRRQDLLADVLADRCALAPSDLRIQMVAGAIVLTLRTSTEAWAAELQGTSPVATLREAMRMVAPLINACLPSEQFSRESSRT